MRRAVSSSWICPLACWKLPVPRSFSASASETSKRVVTRSLSADKSSGSDSTSVVIRRSPYSQIHDSTPGKNVERAVAAPGSDIVGWCSSEGSTANDSSGLNQAETDAQKIRPVEFVNTKSFDSQP